jgi:hypothetical protein
MRTSEIHYRLTVHDARGPETLGPVILRTEWLTETTMEHTVRMLNNGTHAGLTTAFVMEKRITETLTTNITTTEFL